MIDKHFIMIYGLPSDLEEIAMLIKPAVLKSLRKKAGKTQKVVAEELGISQALYSAWENNGNVPFEFDDKLAISLGFTDGTLVDEVFFKDCGGLSGYRAFLGYFEQFLSEGGGRVFYEDAETGIAASPFATLADCGFELPEIPTLKEGVDFEDDFGGSSEEFVDWKSELSRAFFGVGGYLNEFILVHQNFSGALEAIYENDELDHEAYVDLDFGAAGYVWSQILLHRLVQGPDGEPLPFPRMDRDALFVYAAAYEKRTAAAWMEQRRLALSGRGNEPTWSVQVLLADASSDISAVLNTGFDAIQRLRSGYSHDPYVAKLQLQVESLTKMVEALIEKLDERV